jgi:predicted TPR repeat methyltransferase
LSDAIFRFKLVDKVFTPGHSKAKFMLGWCYFIKCDFDKSLKYLNLTDEKEAKELITFLEANKADEIPTNILNTYYELYADKIDELIIENERLVIDKYINMLAPILRSLNKDAKVLDLGCKGGVIGLNIASLGPKNFALEGVEVNQRMCRIAFNRNYLGDSFYNKVHCVALEEFCKKSEEKFDLVIAYNSLNINSSFSPIMKQLAKKSPKAKIILCLKLNKNPGVNFDSSRINFVYDTKTIEEEIKAAGYQLDSIENVQSRDSNKYLLAVCSKK